MPVPSAPVPVRPVDPPLVTVVQSPACHHCHEAREVLTTLQGVLPMRVELVEVTTREGLALAGVHRPASYPLVLLDGEFFSSGRLPVTRLVAALEARAGDRVGA